MAAAQGTYSSKGADDAADPFFEQAPLSAFRLDGSGTIVDVNQRWSEVFGCGREAAVGLGLAGFLTPAYRERFRECLASMTSDGDLRQMACELLDRSGSPLPADLSLRRLDRGPSGPEHLGLLRIKAEAERSGGGRTASDSFLRSTLDGLSATIAVLDEEGEILLVNRAWREFAEENGASAAEVSEGCNYRFVCRSASGSCQEEAGPFAEGIRQVMAREREAFDLEYPCHSPHEKRWFIGRVRPFPDDSPPRRAVVAHENITQRKLAELELRKLRRAVEQSPLALIITDADGTIEYVNPSFCAMTGYACQEVLGRALADLDTARAANGPSKGRSEPAAVGGTRTSEVRTVGRDGECSWERRLEAPVRDERGRTIHFLHFREDITEEKRLEQLKEDVDTIVRHDLKSPLNALIAYPELLLADGNLTQEQRKTLRDIQKTGYRMFDMINLSLILYQMEQGVYTYTPGEVDILRTVRTIEADLAELMKSCGVSFSLHNRLPEAGHSEVIPGDGLLCYSMLSNLIKNAVEAAPRGSSISLTLEASGEGFYEIALHNRGAIPEAVRSSFAQKYATSGKRYGTGLGAYSARLIAEHMGGGLSWSSSASEGTTVRVHLPQNP